MQAWQLRGHAVECKQTDLQLRMLHHGAAGYQLRQAVEAMCAKTEQGLPLPVYLEHCSATLCVWTCNGTSSSPA